MNMMNGICDLVLPLMRRAGGMMLRAHDIESSDNMKEKGDVANLVTIYDVAVQDFLMNEIKTAIPEATFIAEEQTNDASVLGTPYCFIIDPIDGTANFAHGYRHSCISLALFSRGEAVFCAIYDPYQDELFHAIKGGGAFVNGQAIRVAARDFAHAIVAFGTSPYRKRELGKPTFRLAEAFFTQCSDVRRVGSAALDLAYLAAGRNDIFFEYSLSPWDIAAGYLLIREAGGIISDMNGHALDFTQPSTVLAASPDVYEQALALIRSV